MTKAQSSLSLRGTYRERMGLRHLLDHEEKQLAITASMRLSKREAYSRNERPPQDYSKRRCQLSADSKDPASRSAFIGYR